MSRVAVIGAGLSGLVVAGQLRHNHEVVVFEKSRGVGGRLATRYAGDYEFDHGAHYFTARSIEFQQFLVPLAHRGIVATWPQKLAEIDRGDVVSTHDRAGDHRCFVGVPRMNEIGKALARKCDVRLHATVNAIERKRNHWQLKVNNGDYDGGFDWVVLAIPAAQAAALAPSESALQQRAAAVPMRACFSLMLGFSAALTVPWQAALVRHADISRIAVNSSKPGRPPAFTLVVQSTDALAEALSEADRALVTERLMAATSASMGINVHQAACVQLQRWRYAHLEQQLGTGFHIDPALQLAACGDWLIEGRVEAAFASGHELAGTLLQTL
ncbi:MAG: NAD(P)-binding protein [Gammaproteobacteria bacterium]|nr:NAD(P)-binding protein [Gammaproteobacteria bacterium]